MMFTSSHMRSTCAGCSHKRPMLLSHEKRDDLKSPM